MEVVTLIAILVGPVLAILVSRWLDNAREERARKMDIFRTLMRTRRTPVYPEHVGALNLIEIEFAKDEQVMTAWKALLQHFGTNHPRSDNETVNDQMSPEECQQRENNFHDRLYNERQRLLAKLLHAIAKQLGFRVEQLEIFEGGYTPQGWQNIELEQSVIRRFFVDLYLGRRVVPVGVVDYTEGSVAEVSTSNGSQKEFKSTDQPTPPSTA